MRYIPTPEHKGLIVIKQAARCVKLFLQFFVRMVKLLYGNGEVSFRDDSFAPSAPVEAGEEYDVEILDIAEKGDGVARVEGFVIFVPETEVGDQIKISIDRVMRKFAIAHKV